MVYLRQPRGKRRAASALGLILAWSVATPLVARAAEPVSPAPTTSDSQDVSAVVVTGIKQANVKAIETKLNYDGVSDVVSANEVQALPDLTTVETLRRMPGLAVLPTLDNEHPRDETATPVVRGLGAAYNNVTIDGSPIASPGTPNGSIGSVGRGVRLDILPSSMISELAVIKTFSANLDANAVGGAVDLRTRSAFARGGQPFFTFEGALGGANDISKPHDQDQIGGRLVSTGSLTFGADGQYGLVVSANYQKLDSTTDTHMTTDTVHESFYNAAGVLQSGVNVGNGYAVPQQEKYWYVQDSRTRYGLTTKLEAKPSDTLYAFFTGGYYVFKDDMERYENILDPRNRNTVLNQTATSGAYPAGDVEVGYSRQRMTSATTMAQTGLDWKIADREVLSVRANISHATFREPIFMIKYATNNTFGKPGTTAGATPAATAEYATTYDTSSLNHSFAVSPSAWYNLANYKLLYYRPDYKRSATNQVENVRVDYRKNTQGGRGLGYAAGLAFTRETPSYNVYRNDLEPNTSAILSSLASAAGPFGPRLRYNSSGINLLTIDVPRATAQAEALRQSGGLNTTDQSGFSNQDNFEHKESTLGAYGLATYATDQLRAEIGLRSETTDQDTTGRAKVNGAWIKLPTSSSYNFVLPSGLLIYRPTADLTVRFGASQTIGRPSYDAYAARSSISFTNTGDLGNPNAIGVSVTIGNPNIQPRLSTNTDLAVDWRLPHTGGGLVSLALFNKHIKDEIFNAASQGFTYEGVTYVNATVTTPTNASSASVKGLEASVVINSLAALHPLVKDIGFSANWTMMDGEINALRSNKTTRKINRLVGQPDETRNATVFYSRDGLEIRAAYNYQGRALRAIVPDISWQDLYWAPREQVDLHASYRVRPGVTVFAQAQNLTHQRITSTVGYSNTLLKDTYSVPTVVWLGVRITPGF